MSTEDKLKNVSPTFGYTLLGADATKIIMYKQVETDQVAYLQGTEDSGEFTPVATLADEHGGRCQISIDDHCYILRLKQSDGKYKTTAWIFPEAFEVLKTLPSLQPA